MHWCVCLQALHAAVWPHQARAAGERYRGSARLCGPGHLHPASAAPRLRGLVPRVWQGLGGLERKGQPHDTVPVWVRRQAESVHTRAARHLLGPHTPPD